MIQTYSVLSKYFQLTVNTAYNFNAYHSKKALKLFAWARLGVINQLPVAGRAELEFALESVMVSNWHHWSPVVRAR